MDEGTFLLMYGVLFGVPLTIAFIIFGAYMVNHSRYLDRRSKELDEIRKEREEREKLNV